MNNAIVSKKDARAVFAENLRIQCARKLSIAHVCRAVAINRQQFNKYLSGDHLPGPIKRRIICEYFGLTEIDMFTPREEWPESRTSDKINTDSQELSHLYFKRLEAGARALLGGICKKPILKDGFYYCYFPLQDSSDLLVRSLMRITSKNGLTLFTRHTYFRSGNFPPKMIASGRHRGLVLQIENDVFLLGINGTAPNYLSLMTIPHHAASVINVYRGLALTRGISQLYSCRVCLEFLGSSISLVKNQVKQIGVVSNTEKTMNQLVSLIFSSQKIPLPGQLDLPSIEKLLFAELALKTFKNT